MSANYDNIFAKGNEAQGKSLKSNDFPSLGGETSVKPNANVNVTA
jgi:hypothetical protein